MKVVIASGKGGTGKTTVSASLVAVWERPVWAMDLDVEEPNLHLFLNPEITHRKRAEMPVPEVNEALCNHCGKCAELCQFKAISVLGEVVLTFPEMCHGCGGCMAICPEKAIRTGFRELGEISWGRAGEAGFIMGSLRIGEAMSPPLMKAVKAELKHLVSGDDADLIVDAPPGVSCPAVNAVMDSDVIILVTEPTPFGLYDLRLAHKAFSPVGVPMGVVVNRAGLGDDALYRYCEENGLAILAEIPYDRGIAEAYSEGRLIADYSPQMNRRFRELAQRIRVLSGAVSPKEVSVV